MTNTQHLIPIITLRGEQEQWVDARTLHQFLEIGKDFSTWIKDYIEEFGFMEGVDFSPNLGKSTGGRQAIEYTITMDMAKELSMLQRNEKGKQARQYFIAAEKKLRHLENALANGIENPFSLLFSYCTKVQHEGKTYYAASQLRRLMGKTERGGGIDELIYKLGADCKAKKIGPDGAEKWYVTLEGIPELLVIRPNNMINIALLEMIKKGGTQ